MHLRALVLGDKCRGNGQARDIVLLRKSEAELLGVVVDLLNVLQLQANEALVAASEGLVRCSGELGNGALLVLGSG